jgi:hypothetical protein
MTFNGLKNLNLTNREGEIVVFMCPKVSKVLNLNKYGRQIFEESYDCSGFVTIVLSNV